MMRVAAVWIGFLVCSTALGQTVPDGFYLLTSDASAPSLPARNGGSIRVGIPQDVRVQRSHLYAMDNANSQFYLAIWVTPTSPAIDSPFALVVSGHAYRSGGGTRGYDTVNFIIDEAANAELVAHFVGTTIEYRRHPKHEFLVEFIPTEAQFGIGDEVRAKLRITNVGSNTVAFMQGGRNRGTRDNQYVFSALLFGRGVQDIGSNINHGGLGGKRVLAPGEVFEDEISLSKWFAFDQPGYYEIHGSYFLDFLDPDSEGFQNIWLDYVSADFSVRISE